MYAYGTGVTYGLCVLLLIENNGEGECSQLIMFSELLKFLFSVYNFIMFFFSLHRNSPTFKSFEEKVENLKASKEMNRVFLLSCLVPELSLLWVDYSN